LRKALGVLALILGVPALCWYAAGHNGREMQQTVTQGASAAAGRAKTWVSGRDIEVSGVVSSAAERDAILGALDKVEGRRVVRDKIEILPVASPYVFSAERTAAGINASGYVPTDAARTRLDAELGGSAADLKLASGAPDGWSGVAVDGLAALAALEEGKLTMADKTVTLSGIAKTRAEGEKALAALDDLPEGYTLKSSLTYVDQGQPNFKLHYSASDGATVNGKIPAGLTLENIAAALHLDKLSGDAEAGSGGDPKQALSALDKLAGWLPEVEKLTLQSLDKGYELVIEAVPGTDLDLLKSEMADAMGEDVSIAVTVASDLPPEGTSRVNAATGETEVMTRGYWLPQEDFEADYDQCQKRADALLKERHVNFVTASARLDAKSLQVINAITALVRKCVQAGALRVEVAGHTDNQGDADFNQKLSEDRARAVVKALVERGVPEAAITAAGYGETKPIADNDTEEGRAANRRVALVFSQEPAGAAQ
jgi:OOP family OmpA-OmpF porin